LLPQVPASEAEEECVWLSQRSPAPPRTNGEDAGGGAGIRAESAAAMEGRCEQEGAYGCTKCSACKEDIREHTGVSFVTNAAHLLPEASIADR
jgi:hypothetical protein